MRDHVTIQIMRDCEYHRAECSERTKTNYCAGIQASVSEISLMDGVFVVKKLMEFKTRQRSRGSVKAEPDPSENVHLHLAI